MMWKVRPPRIGGLGLWVLHLILVHALLEGSLSVEVRPPTRAEEPGPVADEGHLGRPVAGAARTALQLDGQDDFAVVVEFRGLPQEQITVAAWIRVQKLKNWNRVLSHKWVGNGWNLFVNVMGVVTFGIGQNNHEHSAAAIVYPNRWHHVAGTYDGKHVRIYVDGVEGGKTSLHEAQLENTGYVSIGGAEYDPFCGLIDEAQIWGKALSNKEILQVMTQQQLSSTASLLAYWPFDEGSGVVAQDLSGHGNHAVLGDGARAPVRVPSLAPVAITCAVKETEIKLKGWFPEGTGLDRIRISQGPKAGQVFAGDTLLKAYPADLPSGVQRVKYIPQGGAQGCDSFAYQVVGTDGFESEEAAQVSVQVAQSEEECWKVHEGSCWKEQSRLDYILPATPPPAVSVVIPVYNAGSDLPETVKSVISQTFSDWEIILVNDGSTDSSLQVMQALVAQYWPTYKLRLVVKENGGLADARNTGIQVARGRWILPLDADDLILPTFLERAVAALLSNSTLNLVIADLKGFGAWDYAWKIPDWKPQQLHFTNMFHCSALFPKTLWVAAGGYPPSTLFGYEDWAFWIEAQQATGLHPLRIAEDLFLYRLRRESMHRALHEFQDYAVASLRIHFPSLFPVEMLMDAHELFLEAPEKVVAQVEMKAKRFPQLPAALFMRGVVREGQALTALKDGTSMHGTKLMEAALLDHQMADDLSPFEEWQSGLHLLKCSAILGLANRSSVLEQDLKSKFPILRHHIDGKEWMVKTDLKLLTKHGSNHDEF